MPNEQLHNFVKKLEKLVEETESEIVNDLANGIANGIAEDLNTFQLKDGQLADGGFLPNYSQNSVEKYGKPAGRIKLYDTGEFYSKITAEVRNKKLSLTNYSRKFLSPPAKLAERYTVNIVGLTQKKH